MKIKLTGVIEREGDLYVSICPELNIASQGASIREARANLAEALELFFECADDEEIRQSLPAVAFDSSPKKFSNQWAKTVADIGRPVGASGEVYLTPIEVAHG